MKREPARFRQTSVQAASPVTQCADIVCPPMLIPFSQLSPETLDLLIEDFVTRNGAEHGHSDVPLPRKIDQVRELLRTGKAVISYDEQEETCTIISREGSLKYENVREDPAE
jgi:uncharacterized protein